MADTKFIQIREQRHCSGCTACVAACPKKCITMQEDDKGFLYPHVDTAECIRCSRCLKVCPYSSQEFTNKPDEAELALCYAAYNKNEAIRYKSSSGGMFRAFADRIIAMGGVVFGAAFDKDFTAMHTYSETHEGLDAFMGSKYMQSRMGDCFPKVRQFLQEGRKVLFTGCGCQVSGLKRYLRTDDANLICVDLICHGADTPKMWLEYMHSLFPDEPVTYVNFRDKITGQDDSSIQISTLKSKHYERGKKSIYFRNWMYGLFMRPSCEVCPFKRDNRVSDITIGDCWGFQKIAPEMFDDKGLSSVVIHTDKGRRLFDDIASQIVFKETLLGDVKQFNRDYIQSSPFAHDRREAFWKDYHRHRMPFIKLLEKHLGESRMQKVSGFVRKTIKKCLLSLKK